MRSAPEGSPGSTRVVSRRAAARLACFMAAKLERPAHAPANWLTGSDKSLCDNALDALLQRLEQRNPVEVLTRRAFRNAECDRRRSPGAERHRLLRHAPRCLECVGVAVDGEQPGAPELRVDVLARDQCGNVAFP